MAQPVTAKFGKFQVMLGTPSGSAPVAVTVTSLSNANPAVVTVGASDIGKFADGMSVTIAGATGTGMTAANGTHAIASVGTPSDSFELVGVDTSGGAAPQTTGVTATPPQAIDYAAPCGFTSKSFTLAKNLQEINIPDCDDPDAVAWIGRDAQNLSGTIAGNGVAAAEAVPTWNEAWKSIDSVPAMVEIEFSTGTLTYEGLFQVDNLAFTAEQAGRVQLAVNMQSDGALTDSWTPA
jgi:hypothetical protein